MASSPGFLLGADYSEWAPGATAIATDSSGALYIHSICQLYSTSFCVTKLSADGKTMLWQNNLGFSFGYNGPMAVDPNGGVYVIPEIQPPNISVSVAKLNANGTGLAWTTQVTAAGIAIGNPVIAADAQGRVYVAGPIGPTFQMSVVIRLNTAGSAIDYTAQVAGSVTNIAVDGTGGAFVTGGTTVPFLARVEPDGTAGFNTPLRALSVAGTVAVDPNGNPVVYGTIGNSSSAVLLRFDSTGAVTLSTPVGSFTLSMIGAPEFVLDASGNAYIAGSSYIYVPVRTGPTYSYLVPAKNSLETCGSEWVSVYAPDGTLLQATYIPPGGESIVQAPFIATGPNSTVFVMHSAGASFAPTQTGPFPAGSPSFLWRLSPNPNAQTFPLACLGSAASYETGPIAPGGFVTLFGSGLGPQQGVQPQATLDSPFASQAAGVQVTFDGTPAPLLWVQDAQINVVAPWSLTPGQTTQVCVVYNGAKTNCLTWPVVETGPAVFTTSDGVHAVALNQDGSLNSATNPAALGSIVTVFATGLGPITPPQADGTLVGFPLPTNVLPVTVGFMVAEPPFGPTIFNPFEVNYAGPAPYLVAGASQINFKLGPPANQNGIYPYAGLPNITVSVPSGTSQAFAVYVANQ